MFQILDELTCLDEREQSILHEVILKEFGFYFISPSNLSDDQDTAQPGIGRTVAQNDFTEDNQHLTTGAFGSVVYSSDNANNFLDSGIGRVASQHIVDSGNNTDQGGDIGRIPDYKVVEHAEESPIAEDDQVSQGYVNNLIYQNQAYDNSNFTSLGIGRLKTQLNQASVNDVMITGVGRAVGSQEDTISLHDVMQIVDNGSLSTLVNTEFGIHVNTQILDNRDYTLEDLADSQGNVTHIGSNSDGVAISA